MNGNNNMRKKNEMKQTNKPLYLLVVVSEKYP